MVSLFLHQSHPRIHLQCGRPCFRSPEEGKGYPLQYSWAFLVAQMVKNHLQCGRPGFYPWVGKSSWRRAWQPTPVFLPRESQGQRSLEGCSPQGHKESDTTEQPSTVPSIPRVRAVVKDSALREKCAIETIWTVHVTEPVKDST